MLAPHQHVFVSGETHYLTHACVSVATIHYKIQPKKNKKKNIFLQVGGKGLKVVGKLCQRKSHLHYTFIPAEKGFITKRRISCGHTATGLTRPSPKTSI